MIFRRARRRSVVTSPARTIAALRRASLVEELEERRLLAVDLAVTGNVTPDVFPNVNGAVVAGMQLTYQITVANNGDTPAQNVHLTDLLPPHTTFFTESQTGGVPATQVSTPPVGQGGTVDFTIPVLDPFTSSTFTLKLNVDSNTPEGVTITNTPIATTDTQGDPNPGNNSVSLGELVTTRADLQVVKTGPATTIAGTDLVYTVTITNNGPSDSINVDLQDNVPAFTSFVSAVQTSGPAFSITTPPLGQSGQINATIPSLVNMASATFRFTVHSASGTPDMTMITNTAQAQPLALPLGTRDPAPLNNTSTVVTTVGLATDLVVTNDSIKTQPIIEGKDVVYIVTVTNNGPSDAAGVTLTWPTPDLQNGGTVFVSMAQLSGPAFALAINPGPPVQPGAPGTITATIGTLVAGGTGVFRFEIFPIEEGQYRSIATVASSTPEPPPAGGVDFTLNNTATDIVDVIDAPLIPGIAPPISAIAGRPIELVTVMTFDDSNRGRTIGSHTFPGGQAGNPALGESSVYTLQDFSATVDWGDGTITTQNIVITADRTSHKYVLAGHTYAQPGVYAVHTTVHDEGGAQASLDTDAVVSFVPPLTGNANNNLTAVEGSSTRFLLGTMTDPLPGAKTYTGTVDWRDGTAPSAVQFVKTGTTTFNLFGTHTFAEEGNYAPVVSIQSSVAQTLTLNMNIPVSDPAVIGAPVSVTAQPNVNTGTIAVATFTDPGGAEDPTIPTNPARYRAVINWGDGTPNDVGQIVLNGATGVFTVNGSHTYATNGTRTITTTVFHRFAPNTVITSTATVGADVITITPKTFSGTAANPLNNVNVATFTSSNSAATAATYTATINWGDGTAASTGTVTQTGTGAFSVNGTHTYAAAGTFHPVITVKTVSSGATTTSGPGTANIAANPVTVVGKSVSGSAKVALNGVVIATFTSTGSGQTAGSFTATVNWGDGTAATTGTITQTGTGAFSIKGTHTYNTTGTFHPTITVKTNSTGSTSTATATATITSPIKPVGTSFSVVHNTTFTSKVIGSFNDATGNVSTGAGKYTATITWGDGTATSTGTVVYNSTTKRFDVKGTHKYLTAKSTGYKISVLVKAISGTSAGFNGTISSTAFVS